MNIGYATVNDCIDIVSSLADETQESANLETSLYQSLLDASRLFEGDVNAPEGFFAPASDDFSVRKFYGKGTSRILLPPFTELEYVHDSDDELIETDEYEVFRAEGYTVNGYYVQWNYIKCGRFFWANPVYVSAKWGFNCIPGDVTVAVKSMGCLMFLLNSQARLGNNTVISDEQETRLRNTYNRIVETWKAKFYNRQLGVV